MKGRRFIIDASVTFAWLFEEDKAARRIESMLAGAQPIVPWLWRLEVVNVILVRERRKHLTAAQGAHLLELLEDWDIEVIGKPPVRSLTALASTARPHQLSAYDAIYLDLAVSLGLPLFTRDTNLETAAERIGVELIRPGTS